MRTIRLAAISLLLPLVSSQAQTPGFTIVPAAPASVQPAAPAPGVPATTADSDDSALRLLQQMKAANETILAKQAATLVQLEELEKAAEQVKIFSKRS
jgi:hypothetical protein